MGLFDKIEQSLDRAVNRTFARTFKAEVQPVELASGIRRAMDDRATSGKGSKRTIVPNLFTVQLSDTDYDNLTRHEDALVDELKASAAEHVETQRYTPGGPLTVKFIRGEGLETGVFKIRPEIARQTEISTAPPSGPQPVADGRREHRDGSSFALPGQRRDQPIHEQSTAPPTPYGQYVDDDAQGGQEEYEYHAGQDQDHPQHGREPLAPSPAAPRSYRERPRLEIDGQQYPLLGAITVIGRDDDVDIVLDDGGISRRHSEIRVTNDGPHLVAKISDLGSTNGTFVNGERIRSVRLQDGDRVTVGRTSFLFRQGRR